MPNPSPRPSERIRLELDILASELDAAPPAQSLLSNDHLEVHEEDPEAVSRSVQVPPKEDE